MPNNENLPVCSKSVNGLNVQSSVPEEGQGVFSMLFLGLSHFNAPEMIPPYFLECMALFRFHSFSVPSSEAVRSTAWPGWNVSARMASKWLRSVKRGFHVFLNSSLLSCIWRDKHWTGVSVHVSVSVGWDASHALFQNRGVITSMERSLSLATVRSASSPRFMSPPPTASIMKTSEEKPRAPPAGTGRKHKHYCSILTKYCNTKIRRDQWKNKSMTVQPLLFHYSHTVYQRLYL